MITNLHIKNIGIIDEINVALNDGFNVLTGETGAGKSLLIESLNIIAGGRFSKDMIRNGKEYSLVEACIYLPGNKASEDGNIIVSREVYINGRNLCKINGRMVTVNQLREFMRDIIDIHGQSDNQKLMNPQNHIEYVDDFSGDKIIDLKNKYHELYNKYLEIKNELNRNYGDDKQKQLKLDLLYYQLNEINNANLKVGEDEELVKKQKIYQNSEKIVTNLSKANDLFENKILNSLNTVINSLNKVAIYDDKYNSLIERINGAYYDIQDVSYTISEDFLNNDYNDKEAEIVQDRLDLIFNLKRKYGNTISEILEYKLKLEKEINDIENLDEYIIKLKKQLKTIKEEMHEKCIELNKIRKNSAIELEEKITKELKELEMFNAEFKINVEFEEENYNKNGLNNIEFMISTNIGEEYKPLVKIASGGELSRIMLAIKTVFSDVDNTPIMIFDEIDTGISGVAASSVSEKMRTISLKHQVICVTHLAVIAAKAKYNYYIYKDVIDGKTYSNIKLLDERETLNEIARISTGSTSKIAIEHAIALRKEKRVS